MPLRKLLHVAALAVFSVLSARAAGAQEPPRNLLNAEGWRAYRDAAVEEAGGERQYAVRAGGHLSQDVSVPEEFTGHYVLMTAEARCAPCADGKLTGRPTLHGYMMNAGSPDGGRIYAYLQGPSMIYAKGANGEWMRLWGVFRIPTGTKRVRFFLQRASHLDEFDDGRAALFRDAALHVFPTESGAHAFLNGATASGSTATATETSAAPVTNRPCTDLHLKTFEVAGLRLGMNLDEALAFFPGAAEEEALRTQVERARRSDAHGFSHLLIDARHHTPAPDFAGVEHYWLKFLDGRLFHASAGYGRDAERSGVRKDAVTFIDSLAGRLGLPPPERWEKVDGHDRFSRYLVCDSAELRFFARRGSAQDRIDITDLSAEQLLADRKQQRTTTPALRRPDRQERQR